MATAAPPERTQRSRAEDESVSSARRYSERDLLAFLWLREQIILAVGARAA